MPFLRPKWWSLRFLNRLYQPPFFVGFASILLAMMSVTITQAAPAHLINISARAPIQGGAYDIIAGFGISGTGTQRVILRGIIVGAGVDPKLTLRTIGGDFLDENDDWQQGPRANEISQLPAHLQPTTLNDAALLLDLAPGYYTATLSSVGATGIGLVGIDAIETNGASTEIELINISARAPVQGGYADIVGGFGISGTGKKRVILRGIQVETGVDPILALKTLSGNLLDENDQWQSSARVNEIRQLPAHLQPTSTNDAGLLLDLTAGYYTVTLSSDNAKGIGLVGVDAITLPKTKDILFPEPNTTLDFDIDTFMHRIISLKNETDLGIKEVTITGSAREDFSVNISDPFLMIEMVMTVTVQCTPSTEGIRRANLQIITNNDTHYYDLQCHGKAIYDSSPKSGSIINLGNHVVGTTQLVNVLTIGNNGNIDLKINDFSNSSGTHASNFSIVSFPFTIEKNEKAKGVEVLYMPSSEGLHTANLQFVTNDGIHNYTLQGNGVIEQDNGIIETSILYSSPKPDNTLDLGSSFVGTAIEQNILTLGNTGKSELTVDFVAFSGKNGSDFKIIKPKFPLTITAGKYQAITIQCNPSSEGLREATLQLSTNDPNQSFLSYPLKCDGTIKPKVVVCSSPDFTPTERNDDIIGSLGFGYDNQRDIFKPQSCLKGTTTEVGSGWSNLDFTSISDYEELKRHLGIQVNFNVKATFFKMKAETKFALDHRETELSRSLLFKVDVRLPNGQFNQNGLSEFGQDMHNKGHQCFKSACGDQFIFQTEQGGSLYMAMKFDFTNAESKKEFFAKIEGKYEDIDMSSQVEKNSSFVKKTGKVTLSAYQVGGDVTKLANIFGTDAGLSPFLTCKLTQFDKCQQAMQNAINYAKSDFDNSINSKPHLLGYQGVSYKDMGISFELEPVNPAIIKARKDLAYKFEWQYSDLLLTRSWLDDFSEQLAPEAKQYLKEMEKTLDTNIELLSHAGMWCFSDLTLCLNKKQEAFDNLRDYNKDWLHEIQVMPVEKEEYLDQKSFTLGYFKVKGCKWSGCGDCESRSGQVCLDSNCVVDKNRSYRSVTEHLPGNEAHPGIGINITNINVHGGSYATNLIDGRCLKSTVQMCNESSRFGGGAWYEGTHTIYGKCTKVLRESYLYVPPLP